LVWLLTAPKDIQEVEKFLLQRNMEDMVRLSMKLLLMVLKAHEGGASHNEVKRVCRDC
jgi:hypothetical protein